MQRIDDRQDSGTLSMEKNLRALVLPFFLAIASFLLVDKMNNIETRIKKIEEMMERTIEMKYEIKKAQEDIQSIKSLNKQPTGFPEKGDEQKQSPLIAILNEGVSLSKKRKK